MSDEQNQTDQLTADKLAKALKVNIARALQAGNTAGVAKDIRELRQLEKEMAADKGIQLNQQPSEGTGIPERNRIKRKYTLTPAATAARRRNAQKSTGPTSAEGKKASARNSHKHGGYAHSRILGLGKPCKSTCGQYPCALVEEGRCAPGTDCLNKEHLLEACMAIERALIDQQPEDLNNLVVFELGETLQLIRELRTAVLEDGVIIKSDKFDKDGALIGFDIKEHPALSALPKLVKAFGLTMPDFNLTPAAIAKVNNDGEVAKTLGDIFRTAGGALTADRKQEK